MESCTGLFDHSIGKLRTVSMTRDEIIKTCDKCKHVEVLPRSNRNIYFVNDRTQQRKKWAVDDNKKELLQPMNQDGSTNDEFTEAYGYNPFDERTKAATPHLQGGLA